MSGSLESTGIPSMEELEAASRFPTKDRLMKGPVAVIECLQKIPCNPCEKACPFGAIKVNGLIGLPELNGEICTGCGSCIAHCPGLAIFVIDCTFSEDDALIHFPYEYLPLPEVGSIVNATDRAGKVVTKGKVVKVLARKSFDHTAVVSISVPKKFVNEVRGIAMPDRGEKA